MTRWQSDDDAAHLRRVEQVRELLLRLAELFVADRIGAENARRRVALKRILPGFARDPSFRRLFIHEARVAMKLSHANLVQVYDFHEFDGTYVLAMEYEVLVDRDGGGN